MLKNGCLLNRYYCVACAVPERFVKVRIARFSCGFTHVLPAYEIVGFITSLHCPIHVHIEEYDVPD